MVDNGNGTFTITNKKTGQAKVVKGSELSNYGLEAPKSYSQGAFEGTVDKTGLYNLPGGSLIRAVTHPLLKGAETVAEGGLAGGQLLGEMTGLRKMQASDSNPTFISQQENQNLNGSLGQATMEGLKTGAGTAAYAVPGGGFVGGVSNKGLSAAGAMSGFGDTQSNDPIPLAENSALGGILGPFLGKLVPDAGASISDKIFGGLTEKLPTKIRTRLDIIQKQLGDLEKSKMQDMVGYSNIDKARNLGIHAEHNPEDVVRIVQPEMDFVGENLNDILSHDAANATIGQITDAFERAQKQVVPGLKDVNLNDFKTNIKNFLQQNITDELDSAGVTQNTKMTHYGIGDAGTPKYSVSQTSGGPTPGQLVDFNNNESPISLAIVNKIKQRLGERFDEDPLYKQAYKNIQQLIEEQSGKKDEVRALNSEYNTLRDIRNQSQKVMDKGLGPNILDYTSKKDSLLNKPIADPGLAAAAATAGLGGQMLGPLGAIPGGTYATYRLLVNLLRNPGSAAKIASILEVPGNAMKTPAGKAVSTAGNVGAKSVKKVLEAVSPRLGNVLTQ